MVAWVRSIERGRARLGGDVTFVEDNGTDQRLQEALAGADAVVNLAGESIFGRWTPARKAALRASRVGVTERLVATMRTMPVAPRVLVSGSATGFYGDRGSGVLPEEHGPGTDFLAQLCRDWEAAANAARDICRVVTIRTSVVLARDGGALPLMAPAFKLGLGGAIGNGRQYLPWIHIADLVEIIARAIEDERYNGPLNAVSPNVATAGEFARAVGTALRRPAAVPLPAVILRLVLGEAADALLFSQRAHPRALHARHFVWRFPTLAAALADLLRPSPSVVIRRITPGRALNRHQPAGARYVLSSRTVLESPVAETFPFFSRPENLGLLTPASMQFVILRKPDVMAENAIIDYRIRVAGVPMRWRTRILRWQHNEGFVDMQEAGPYQLWYHEHTFRADGPHTVMDDRVYYTPPLGILGRIAHALVIRHMLLGIFHYRQDVIRLRFG